MQGYQVVTKQVCPTYGLTESFTSGYGVFQPKPAHATVVSNPTQTCPRDGKSSVLGYGVYSRIR